MPTSTPTDFFTLIESELTVTFSRSSGPGGQNVNKVNTKVTVLWPIKESPAISAEQLHLLLQNIPRSRYTKEGIQITSERYRSQGQNYRDCLEKLGRLLESALTKRKSRVATKPSRSAKERRLKAKKLRSVSKALRKEPE